jgi:hypothetical protein
MEEELNKSYHIVVIVWGKTAVFSCSWPLENTSNANLMDNGEDHIFPKAQFCCHSFRLLKSFPILTSRCWMVLD